MMELLGLSDNDLVVNRGGHLSLNQKMLLRRKSLEIIIGYGIFVFCFAVALVYGVKDINVSHSTTGLGTAIFGAIGTLVMIGLILYKAGQIWQDLNLNKPYSATGKIALRMAETRSPDYRLFIGQLELSIPKRAYQRLQDGKQYHVYYTPNSRIILAIERMH
jgi:hypothetical protein